MSAFTEQNHAEDADLLQQAVRRNPNRADLEGNLVADSIVRHAVRNLPMREAFPHTQSDGSLTFQFAIDFLSSLAVDGWTVENRQLIPATPVPIGQAVSRLKSNLQASGFAEPLKRLDQLEHGLDDAHWESANADTRAFLSAVFNCIAKQGLNTELEEGNARKALVEHQFFKPDQRNPKTSLEGDFVQKMVNLLGSEGAHGGTSDQATAVYRYSLAVLTADYFLARHREKFS